jgi:pimeloyl-ACP methyl ester carboxylesterase
MQYEATGSLPNWVIDTPFLYRWARILIRSIMPESTAINLRSAAENDAILTDELIEDAQRVYHTRDWDLSLLALARDSNRNALAEPLQTMELPVLILWGEEDRWIAPDIGVKLEADFPHAQRRTFSEVGHLPMLEDPKAFAQALRIFWESQARSSE